MLDFFYSEEVSNSMVSVGPGGLTRVLVGGGGGGGGVTAAAAVVGAVPTVLTTPVPPAQHLVLLYTVLCIMYIPVFRVQFASIALGHSSSSSSWPVAFRLIINFFESIY